MCRTTRDACCAARASREEEGQPEAPEPLQHCPLLQYCASIPEVAHIKFGLGKKTAGRALCNIID